MWGRNEWNNVEPLLYPIQKENKMYHWLLNFPTPKSDVDVKFRITFYKGYVLTLLLTLLYTSSKNEKYCKVHISKITAFYWTLEQPVRYIINGFEHSLEILSVRVLPNFIACSARSEWKFLIYLELLPTGGINNKRIHEW